MHFTLDKLEWTDVPEPNQPERRYADVELLQEDTAFNPVHPDLKIQGPQSIRYIEYMDGAVDFITRHVL